MPARIFAYVWNNHMAVMERIDVKHQITAICPTILHNKALTPDMIKELILSNEVTLICWQSIGFIGDVLSDPDLAESKIIVIGSDPSVWSRSTVDMSIVSRCYEYMSKGGDENFARMFDYISASVLGGKEEVKPPVDVPWQSIVGYKNGELFDDPLSYIESYGLDRTKPFVGIMASRAHYTMDGLSLEKRMCEIAIEYGMNPILVYTMYRPEPGQPVLTPSESVRRFMWYDGKPLVSAIAKLSIAHFGSEDDSGSVLKDMDVPLFAPVLMSRMSVKDWEECSGLTSDVTWKIMLPELEGGIEPIPIGSEMDLLPRMDKKRVLIEERCRKAMRRIARSVALQTKPNSEKRVLLFLNNFPCHGAEANIGNAGGMDALESVARILQRMAAEGYDTAPVKDGKELKDLILEKKALNEFRWTTVQEIKGHGGVLYEMGADEYEAYLRTLPDGVPEDIVKTWGEPPGQSMVLNGKILISGIRLGNVIVALEPKRGCYGPRCDGKVCKILQDPVCAPTHQFMAEMHYFNDIWKADVMVHIGSHGCLEFLPGKSTGLSERCYPDLCVGDTPHIYLYTTDNPTEGMVAKRRSYATIVSHMQAPMKDIQLYGDLAEMDSMMRELETSKDDPSRSEALRVRMVKKHNSVNTARQLPDDIDLDACIRHYRSYLSSIRGSQTIQGLHVFGEKPEGEGRVDMVYSILRFNDDRGSLMHLVSDSMGYDLDALSSMEPWEKLGDKSVDDIRGSIRERTREHIAHVISSGDTSEFPDKDELILDISNRIDGSDEMGSLMRCMSGRYIEPSPSGFITRGRYDVLPTGRNFYSMDPKSVPTRSAWETGVKLAESAVKRFMEDEGRMPETIGYNWNFSDILVCGGETMSQMMHLLGAEPTWGQDGSVKGFRIIPMEELGRPRIDTTIGISTMLIENMPGPMDYLHSVIESIMDLDEPLEFNFPRKHMLESIEDGADAEESKTRMFGSGPGCGSGGLYLAILASAWEGDKDLVDFYLNCKGYGYGGDRKGKPMISQFARMLALDDFTFDKIHSDSVDVLSSGRYSSVGGMSAATKFLSGKESKTYYGDTSDPLSIPVRSLSEELDRVISTKLLNPQWIDAMKRSGYAGASEITKRVTRVYGWQCSTKEIEGRTFDRITDEYVRNEDNYSFLRDNNVYAAEEMVRRLLEANTRGLWKASEEDLALLQDRYLELESNLESLSGEGEHQGGNIDIYRYDSLPEWEERMKEASKVSSRYRDALGP